MRSSVFNFLKRIIPSSLEFKGAPRLLGRYSPGAGVGQEIKLGTGLTLDGDTLHSGADQDASIANRAVLHDRVQGLDDDQKERARGNIEAGAEVLVFESPPVNATVDSFTLSFPERSEMEGTYVFIGVSELWGDRVFGRQSEVESEISPLRLEGFDDVRGRGAVFRQDFLGLWSLSYCDDWDVEQSFIWLGEDQMNFINGIKYPDPTAVPFWMILPSEELRSDLIFTSTSGTGGTPGLANQLAACGNRTFRCQQMHPPRWIELPSYEQGIGNTIRYDIRQDLTVFEGAKARQNLGLTDTGYFLQGSLDPDFRCVLLPRNIENESIFYSTEGLWSNDGTKKFFVTLARDRLPDEEGWYLRVYAKDGPLIGIFASPVGSLTIPPMGSFILDFGDIIGSPELVWGPEVLHSSFLPIPAQRVVNAFTSSNDSTVRLLENNELGSDLAIRNETHGVFQRLRVKSGPEDEETLTLAAPISLTSVPANGVAGTRQVETVTAVGTATADGYVDCVITRSGVNSLFGAEIQAGDTPAVWAEKLRAALRYDYGFTDLYEVGGSGAQIVVMKIKDEANDASMNVALRNHAAPDSPGITNSLTSTNTTAGIAPILGTDGARGQMAIVNESSVYLCIREYPAKWIAI